MVRAVAWGAVLAAIGCKSGAGSSDDPDLKVSNAPSKGSAGGFSASLGAELGMGSGSAMSGSAAASASASAPTSGSAGAPASGSGSVSASGSATAPGAGSVTASGSATASGTGSGPGTTAFGSGTGTTASGTGAGTTASGSGTQAPGAGTTGTTATGAGTTPSTSGAAPVAVSAEVAAIKLTLTPGWERDVGEGGTFSRFVSVDRTGQSALFKFHYGYEDARAPQDRDAYKKFLTESQILRVLNDRQRGTAWLLEGKDATGAQAFRMVVIYGGKRLVCWGSQYKDSSLGDVRDEVVTQARKICESISL